MLRPLLYKRIPVSRYEIIASIVVVALMVVALMVAAVLTVALIEGRL
jgi:hypothetical protein